MILTASLLILSASTWWQDAVAQARDLRGNLATTLQSLENDPTRCAAVSKTGGLYLRMSQDHLATASAMLVDRNAGDGSRYQARKVLELALPLVVESEFMFADTLLKHSCFDEADAIYRGMLGAYVGVSYEAIRDRAQTGIDDVRAKRPAPPASPAS